MKYNPDKHHRRSIRLKGYDYSQEGLYFITLCVQNHECLFGEIINGEMQLNEMGKVVKEEWEKSAKIRREIEIHEYIIMPNHFHAIAKIIPINANDETPVGANGIRPNKICTNHPGECHSPLRSPSKTLGALVRGFKSSVTKQLGYSIWQRNYYEHIIRNTDSYVHISEYIVNNPVNWRTDKFYKKLI